VTEPDEVAVSAGGGVRVLGEEVTATTSMVASTPVVVILASVLAARTGLPRQSHSGNSDIGCSTHSDESIFRRTASSAGVPHPR
jgi:hypothetical protein